MASFNKVLLMGNLTRDIEIRHTSSNMAVANGGLAVNRKYKTKDGQSAEEVVFVDFEAWGRTAEVMGQYLSKGSPVFIEGRLKLEEWEDKNGGGKRSKLRVTVESFQFLDGGEGKGAQPKTSASGGHPEIKSGPVVDPNDIPF